jgi:radical SAM/Cys-rich protein
MMSMEVILQCLTILKNTPSITTLDITGGAPELHEHFRTLVSMARAIRPNPDELDIIDRCNLTVLYEPNQGKDLIQFLQQHHVHIVASLPCYSETNVNEQRGNQVFERSIAALIALNDAGFGISDLVNGIDNNNNNNNIDTKPKYKLDLVYNPAGAFLPPPQDKLQIQYKEQLYKNFGIVFDDLFTITNMPIQRFADYLYRRDELIEYMDLLVRNYNPATIDNIMCQNTVSIRYDGIIYDCDFNQQLDIPILTHKSVDDNKNNNNNNNENGPRRPLTVFDITSLDDIMQYKKIRTDVHCFGCTAGMGSSCQGATATE